MNNHYLAVFLDTEFFKKIRYDIEHQVLRLLVDLSKKGTLNLVITDITYREIKKKIDEDRKEFLAVFNKFLQKGGHILLDMGEDGLPNLAKSKGNQKTETSTVYIKLEEFISKNFQYIECYNVDVKAIFDKYFCVAPPFQVKPNKKCEFPDAFIMESLIKYQSMHNSTMVVITNDDGLLEACKLAHNFYGYSSDQCKQAIEFIQEKVEQTAHIKVLSNLSGIDALRNNEFFLVYLPQVDIKANKIIGVEALIRWKNPELGVLSPVDFIPLAEEKNHLDKIEKWALEEACMQMKIWHNNGYSGLKLAINISPKEILSGNIVNTVADTLNQLNFDASYLELEFTENATLDEKAISVTKKLKELGLHLAIDNFGTGYSGLTYIKQFSVKRLNIDKSFIQDIGRSKESETIILVIIEMAKKLDMQTLAEGVETEEQINFLKQHNCDLAQGYYFSKPLNASELTTLLNTCGL